MLLYLVQHAEAKTEEEDPSRGLSDRGKEEIQKVSALISQCNVKLTKIYHSQKLRAGQTANILADSLNPTRGVSEADGLSPLENPSIWVEKLLSIEDDIMLVGHLPHLGKLASLLLCGDENKHIISFTMAGIACLERDGNGIWSIQWMIIPSVVA